MTLESYSPGITGAEDGSSTSVLKQNDEIWTLATRDVVLGILYIQNGHLFLFGASVCTRIFGMLTPCFNLVQDVFSSYAVKLVFFQLGDLL